MFPIDASRIAGVANGQTIYLPGFFGNQLYSGSPVVIPAHTTSSTSSTDPNQKYMLQNEDFTALGNVGHHVRVPIPNNPPTIDLSSSSGSSAAHTPSLDGTITIDPTDIIGVADMNQIGPDGNPSFFSFNPGTGHASEISALQSALQGTAVDMSSFLPPPFDTPSSITNMFPSSSGTSSSTSSTSSTQESTNFDIMLEAGPSSMTFANNSAIDFHGTGTTSGRDYPSEFNSAGSNTNRDSIFSTMTSSQNTQTTNEQTMYDTLIDTGSSKPTTQGKSTIGSGSQFENTFNNNIIGMPSIFITSKPTVSGLPKSISGGVNISEQSMTTSNEQSMLSTSALTGGDRINTNTQSTGNMNEQSMFGTNSNTKVINSNERGMFDSSVNSINLNSNKQSLMDTSGNSKSINSNDQSMFGVGTTGGLSSNIQSNQNVNEQSMFSTGNSISGMNSNEHSMFGTISPTLGIGARVGLNSNNNEQSMFDTGQFIDSSSTNMHSLNGQTIPDTARTTIGINSIGEPTVSISAILNQDNKANNIGANHELKTTIPNTVNMNSKDTVFNTAGNTKSPSTFTTGITNTINKQSHTIVGNRAKDTSSQTDTFTSGQNSKYSLMDGQTIGRITLPSINNDIQSSIKENNFQSTNKISTVQTDIHPPSIIPKTEITNDQNLSANEPSFVNVDSRIGIRTGSSDTGSSINGLLGTVNSDGGSSLSSFNNVNTGSQLGGGEKSYLVSGTGFNTATDTLLGSPRVDSIQSISDRTANILGVSDTVVDNTLSNINDQQLSLPLVDPMFSVADSNIATVTDTANQNEPHLNELNTSGIYPFEGSLTAMDATLSEGIPATLDMSSVLHGREPLHLEPPINIMGEVVSDKSKMKTSASSTGIFAVVGGSGADSVNPKGALHLNSGGGTSLSSTSNLSSSDRTSSIMKNDHTSSGVSFVNGGSNANTLAIDNVNQYVGLESFKNKQKSSKENLESNTVGIDNLSSAGVKVSKMTNNNNRLTTNEQKITEASNLSNKHNKELSVLGNNYNINTFNTVDASSNMVNNKENTITDGVGISMSGFSGAPLTNMAGAFTGTSRGGLTVNANAINDPSLSLTSDTTELSSSSIQESSSVSGSSDFPSGSFVIGAGQPNSKIINAGSLESSSTFNSNVGGIALGSEMTGQNSNIQSISLPDSAFKSNEMINFDRIQPRTETPKLVKVDMTSFIPPPYEDPASTISLNTQDRTVLKESVRPQTINSVTLSEKQNRLDQTRNKFNQVSLEVPQNSLHIQDNLLSQGNSNTERISNAALLNRIGNLHNQVTSSDGSTIVRQFNEHVKNDEAARNMGISGSSLVNTLNSSGEQSNFVRSTEHFGKPVRPTFLAENSHRQHNAKISSFNSQSALPSIVVDRAIFTDLGKDTNMRANEVAVALDIHSAANQGSGRLSPEQFTSQPIVGSIFGTVENSSSNSLTQRFLEKSGITREPAVDFMTTFLQHSKPTRTLNRGNKSLQIVPLGSDMSNFSPNTDKIIIAGRQNDAQTVDKFGVADIYTRKQQLNPRQWQQLMAKVSHEPNSKQNGINVGYLTQNVIGTGETKPLTGKINQGSIISRRGMSSGFTSNTNTRNVDKTNQNLRLPLARKNNLRSATLFEAPGMTGHKSVTIRNYVPRSSRQHSARRTINSRVNGVNDIGQQSLQEFVGTQATAEKTSSFANTFRQKQKTGIEGVPVLNRNGISVNSVSLPLKDRLSTDPQTQSNGQLGEAGKKIQNEMNTFKLGRSILISDGVIPEFTGPNSVQRLPIDTNDLRTLSANGMRLGEPSVLSSAGSLTREQISNQQAMTESAQSSTGSIDLQGKFDRIGRVGSLNNVNNRQFNLGSLDSEMTSILQSRMNNAGTRQSNSHQTATGSLSSGLANNRPVSLESIETQLRNNQLNGIRTPASLNSDMSNNRMSSLGSLERNRNNQLNLRTIDSQLLNNRPSRLGSLDSQILSNRQSADMQSDSRKSSTGEITLQDIQGSAVARGMGSNRQGALLSKRLGIAIGGNRNSDLGGNLVQGKRNTGQGQQNMGIAINGNINNAFSMNTDQFSNTATGSIESGQTFQDISSNSGRTGMSATNIEQRNLDTATILGLNSALKKQPMEATLFTSGSRFAVFGRAGDVNGKSLGASMQAKPVPARRMGVLGPIHDCRFKPDPTSEYYFVYKDGINQHRFRCALGSAFDEMTCECSIRVSDHGKYINK
jgi:hypothetical protein